MSIESSRHGDAYDRGSADAYYSRPAAPHFYEGPSYQSMTIVNMDDEMKNTVKIPVKDLAPVAKKALKRIYERNVAAWEKEINERWELDKEDRHFWFGSLKWDSIEDYKVYNGYVEDGENFHRDTMFGRHFGITRQQLNYKDFITLYKNDQNAIVTLSVADYNILKTYDR